MKHAVLSLVAVLVFCVQSVAQIPTSGLVAWYPFNGNVNDESGNDHHGSAVNSTATTDRFGNPASAWQFSGNGYVKIDDMLMSNSFSDMSISCWFLGTQGYEGMLISDRGTSWPYKYTCHLWTSGKVGCASHDGATLANGVATTQSGLNDGTWHHFVYVVNSSTSSYSLYIDGALAGLTTGVNPSAWSSLPNPTYLGVWRGPGGYDYTKYLTGKLDDICFYNRALSLSEIQTLFQGSPLTVDAGPDQTVTLGYGEQSRTLTATASGGTSPYTYSWSCPSWSTPQTGASVTVTPTIPTTYTVTVTDANNQTATDDVYVNVLDWRCGNNLDKVILCHNGHNICVALSAVPAHLELGDILGGCQTAKQGAVIPGVFSLAQNYPNPFNPSTTIEFGIPDQGAVRLRVIDLLGREVAMLVDETRPAGAYAVDFNATNHPSGTYVYQLEWNGHVINRRMTLMK
ncbi:MAG: T9SS type A sorting domain-containing protein [Bacteroidetes bacterium]|nr:T9SS type A sorting domain-containing protein [Bacteroidota bacterium]